MRHITFLSLTLALGACGDKNTEWCDTGFGRADDGNCYPTAQVNLDTDADDPADVDDTTGGDDTGSTDTDLDEGSDGDDTGSVDADGSTDVDDGADVDDASDVDVDADSDADGGPVITDDTGVLDTGTTSGGPSGTDTADAGRHGSVGRTSGPAIDFVGRMENPRHTSAN